MDQEKMSIVIRGLDQESSPCLICGGFGMLLIARACCGCGYAAGSEMKLCSACLEDVATWLLNERMLPVLHLLLHEARESGHCAGRQLRERVMAARGGS